MPDMAHTKAYKTYSTNPLFADSMSALQPPEGAVPRGYEPYPYPNTKEGYEKAGEELTNPVPKNDSVLAEGKRLFNIYCAVCHGEGGEGNGPITITSDGPFPPPPSFTSAQLKDLPEGKIFHSMTYGKLNTQMPSYSSQLNKKERWKVTHYVQQLQGQGEEQDTTSNTEEEQADVEAETDTTAENS
jgi:mono/diheme cytochrome c family protein